ncbi:MAG: hypothetical protein ACKV2Q_19755 [Planctomycetaceae bacterium]
MRKSDESAKRSESSRLLQVALSVTSVMLATSFNRHAIGVRALWRDAPRRDSPHWLRFRVSLASMSTRVPRTPMA